MTDVSHIVFAGSSKASLIGSTMRIDGKVCRMSNSLCSFTSSNGMYIESATLLMRSWNCSRSSARVGGGGIMASSGEDEKMLVVGVIFV